MAQHQILTAARLVFTERGYSAATVEDIGARAGYAKSGVFRYFGSKADLFFASLCNHRDSFSALIADHLPRALTPPERIHWLARMYLKHWRSHGYEFQIFWAVNNLGEKLPERRVQRFLACCQVGLQVVRETIEDGVRDGDFAPCDPVEVSLIVWRLANAMLMGSDGVVLRRDLIEDGFETHFLGHIDTLLRGLSNGAPRSGRAPRDGELPETRLHRNRSQGMPGIASISSRSEPRRSRAQRAWG